MHAALQVLHESLHDLFDVPRGQARCDTALPENTAGYVAVAIRSSSEYQLDSTSATVIATAVNCTRTDCTALTAL